MFVPSKSTTRIFGRTGSQRRAGSMRSLEPPHLVAFAIKQQARILFDKDRPGTSGEHNEIARASSDHANRFRLVLVLSRQPPHERHCFKLVASDTADLQTEQFRLWLVVFPFTLFSAVFRGSQNRTNEFTDQLIVRIVHGRLSEGGSFAFLGFRIVGCEQRIPDNAKGHEPGGKKHVEAWHFVKFCVDGRACEQSNTL